jgi:ribose 5-phosphate isomerase B
MKIAIGADHRGDAASRTLVHHLREVGHEVEVLHETGTSTDYPDSAYLVGQAIASGRAERGILVCSNGVGMAIAANKIRGVRAALVCDVGTAEQSRRHNDANVVCLGSEQRSEEDLLEIVDRWLAQPFEGGRHERRVRKIKEIEHGRDPRALKEERQKA